MSVASELHTSLRTMGFMQLLLAVVFLACYSIACSTMFALRGRCRAGLGALLSAGAFTALMQPWMHGAMLLAGAVAGLGLFSFAVWLMSNLLNLPGEVGQQSTDDASAVFEPATVESPVLVSQARPAHHNGLPAA